MRIEHYPENAGLARITKGKGIGCLEDDNNWDYRLLYEVDGKVALAEIEMDDA